jgi:hypothetical protein
LVTTSIADRPNPATMVRNGSAERDIGFVGMDSQAIIANALIDIWTAPVVETREKQMTLIAIKVCSRRDCSGVEQS